MKFLKKAVSMLLAAVTAVTMMCAGSVTAGAATNKTEKSPYYVTYKESSEELILTIYGFSEEDYTFLMNPDFSSQEWYDSKHTRVRLAFDDICFKDNLQWEYFTNGKLYDYSEGNYHSIYFDSSLSYEMLLTFMPSEASDKFSGIIYEVKEYDVSPDSYYYGRSYSIQVDTFSGKSKWIDLGVSIKYRYGVQFILEKKSLPLPMLNQILKSTSCKALAGKIASRMVGEKGGLYVDINPILGGDDYGGDDEYVILPSFSEDSESFSGTPVSDLKDISSLNFGKITNKAYTGEALKPSVTVKGESKTLKKGTDYTLTYKNNKAIGTATVTVKGKGNYSGTKTLTFQIVPKKTTLTAKRSGEKITFQWDAVKGAEKYEIFYREKGKSQYKKFATVSGKKTNYSTTELDKNKTYQFQIRSYKKSNGEKIYSKFSKVVTVK